MEKKLHLYSAIRILIVISAFATLTVSQDNNSAVPHGATIAIPPANSSFPENLPFPENDSNLPVSDLNTTTESQQNHLRVTLTIKIGETKHVVCPREALRTPSSIMVSSAIYRDNTTANDRGFCGDATDIYVNRTKGQEMAQFSPDPDTELTVNFCPNKPTDFVINYFCVVELEKGKRPRPNTNRRIATNPICTSGSLLERRMSGC